MLRKLLWTGLSAAIGAAATKPGLMVARAKGEAPTDQEPEPKAVPRGRRARGLNPFLVVGIALAAGIALAKVVDWRGHAHPRD